MIRNTTCEMQRRNKRQNNLLVLMLFLFVVSQSSICEDILTSSRNKDHDKLQKSLQQFSKSKYESCAIQLSPVYYWAQNMTHIFIKFQFVNSRDTSACDRVLYTDKKVQHNTIQLSLVCLQSQFVMRYSLSITTHMPLNFYHALWKQGEQNSLILQCLKSPNPYFWKSLYLKNQAPLRRPKVWWKVLEKYLEQLKKYIYDLQVQDEQNDISGYVRKRKRSRQGNTPYSRHYLYCNQGDPFQLSSWL